MRILVLRQIRQNSVDDIYHHTDYLNYEFVRGTNVGNKLWLMGLVSSISTPDNQIDFLEDTMDTDYINANYDICIKPEANIFSKRFAHYMEKHIEIFGEVNIPIYVIACGVQASSYDELTELIDCIGDISKRFIRSIYRTGGEFCLRGYFTKEFFDRLGFSSAVVTGCPSMYQYGRGFRLDYNHVHVENFKPALNWGGRITPLKKIIGYQNSEFFDQGNYYDIIYRVYQGSAIEFIKKYGVLIAELLQNDRLKLFVDLQDWADYLKLECFSFSCGSRIHGSIMPILMGIPAVIYPIDSRTQEMAEYFDIPMISKHDLKKKDLYEIYLDTNYKRFNDSFSKKYDIYEKFLIERGIVKKANTVSLLNNKKSRINTDRLDYVKSIQANNSTVLEEIENKQVVYRIIDYAKEKYINLRR